MVCYSEKCLIIYTSLIVRESYLIYGLLIT
jgi:hypothetical protein